MAKKNIFIILLIVISTYSAFYISNIKHASIDKIYVVNLDDSKDRFAYMQKSLAKVELPVKYERFSAINGDKIKIINRNTKVVFTGKEVREKHLLLKGEFEIRCSDDDIDYISGKIEWNYYHPRAIGELGYACSNRKIWQEIVEKKYKNTLIMEDDIKLHPDFTDLLEKAANNAPKDYDILYLNVGSFAKAYRSNAQNPLLKPFMNAFDQHIRNFFWKQARRNIRFSKAYIVSEDAAAKLLECTKHIPSGEFFAADTNINKCIENEQIIAYVSKPQLINASDHLGSEIEK